MVRKLSKVRSKLVGSTDNPWVRIPTPRFVRSMTLQPRAPGWPLKKQQPASLDAGPVHRSSIVIRTWHYSRS